MNIGLVAHDAKKKLMQNFCIAYRVNIICMQRKQQVRWLRMLQT